MRTNELIVDTLERAFTANAWHGPSLMETLEETDYETASARPLAVAHSIWELIIHLTAWKDVVRQRLGSATPILPSDAEDWPQLPEPTAANWISKLEKLQRSHDELVKAVRSLAPQAFARTIPGKDYDAFVMLFGVAQHDDYHAGQIALLKKAARRSK